MEYETALVITVDLAGILNKDWATAYLSSAFAMICLFLQPHIRLERRLVSRLVWLGSCEQFACRYGFHNSLLQWELVPNN
jgi:hypothetical protein